MGTARMGAAALSLAGAMAAAGVALPAERVDAAVSTCQGKAVTVQGNTGTDGADVMVTDPLLGSQLFGGGGDDLICIRSVARTDPYAISVDAGPGNDVVVNEVTHDNIWVSTLLGAGADTYQGSDRDPARTPTATSFVEMVSAGAAAWWRESGDATDTEADVIDTRGGDDVVFAGSTTPGEKNRDSITTGDGDDTLHWAGEQVGPAAALGEGGNVLHLYRGLVGTAVAVDAPRAVVTVDARPALRWTGPVSQFVLRLDNPHQAFTGTGADEELLVDESGVVAPASGASPDTERRSITMGGGDDTLAMYSPGSGRLDGGRGEDKLTSLSCDEADVRLGGTYECLVSGARHAFGVDGWEDVLVTGGDLVVVGSPGPDRIKAVGRRIRLLGRGGDDRLDATTTAGDSGGPVLVSGGRGSDAIAGSFAPDRLLGGAGSDRLVGGPGKDTIVGGAGRDVAVGRGGRDRCEAEVRRSCER